MSAQGKTAKERDDSDREVVRLLGRSAAYRRAHLAYDQRQADEASAAYIRQGERISRLIRENSQLRMRLPAPRAGKRTTGPRRPVFTFFDVGLSEPDESRQRITLQSPYRPEDGTRYLTIQDAEKLIKDLQRAIKRAPRAR